MKELAADGIPVAVTCRVLKLSRQPYYRWLADPVTDAELAAALIERGWVEPQPDSRVARVTPEGERERVMGKVKAKTVTPIKA